MHCCCCCRRWPIHSCRVRPSQLGVGSTRKQLWTYDFLAAAVAVADHLRGEIVAGVDAVAAVVVAAVAVAVDVAAVADDDDLSFPRFCEAPLELHFPFQRFSPACFRNDLVLSRTPAGVAADDAVGR